MIYELLKQIVECQNFCIDGSYFQKEGKYDEVLVCYQECVDFIEDLEVKVQILFFMVFILIWQKGCYGEVNVKVCEVVSLKVNWGKFYMLMGDIIFKCVIFCDDWNCCLVVIVVIDKYSYVCLIDFDVVGDVGICIGCLMVVLLGCEDGFMCKVSEGQSVMVSCIGEMVKVCFCD